MTGALYTAEGQIITQSVRSVPRLAEHLPCDPPLISVGSRVIGKHNFDGHDSYLDEAIFGGHIYAGWGHNITETISTVWSANEVDPNVPLLMVPWGRLWVSALPRIRETMRLAGWGDRRVVLTSGSAIIGKVYVPDRLVQLDSLYHECGIIPPEMNDVYDHMIEQSTSSSEGANKRPTFLARARNHRRAHEHETAVEVALAERGFRIVEGWNLSVQEQISVANSASALVAFSGSSLHNSVFADRGTPIFEIMDERATLTRQEVTPLQIPLCMLREQPFIQVDGFADEAVRPLADILNDLEVLVP